MLEVIKSVINGMRAWCCRVFLLVLILVSCQNKQNQELTHTTDLEGASSWKAYWENPNQKEQLLSNPNLHKRIKESLKETSIVVLTGTLMEDLERFSKKTSLGDINNDGINDSILVIPELYVTKEGAHEHGASAIFTDKTIPRIRVAVDCLDPDYLFPVDDIDEDGVTELGQYYTSCASRFKGLRLLSLDNNEWKIKGQVTFDIFYELPAMEARIEKTDTCKFRMREITSEHPDSITDVWKQFEMF